MTFIHFMLISAINRPCDGREVLVVKAHRPRHNSNTYIYAIYIIFLVHVTTIAVAAVSIAIAIVQCSNTRFFVLLFKFRLVHSLSLLLFHLVVPFALTLSLSLSVFLNSFYWIFGRFIRLIKINYT